MPNDYYTAGTVSRHTLARAEVVAAELQSVQSGFAKLPALAALLEDRVCYAVDGGTLNAYAVTLPSSFTLTDGAKIRMRTATPNTGPCTINPTPSGGAALGNITIKRSTGAAPIAGDIDLLAELVYDSVLTAFVIISQQGGSEAASAASAAAALASQIAAAASATSAAASALAAAASATSSSGSATSSSASAVAAAASAASIIGGYNATGVTGFIAGTAAAPGIYVVGDTNTGLAQLGGADTYSLVCGGKEVGRFSIGASATNYLKFETTSTNAIVGSSADGLGFKPGGTLMAVLNASYLAISNGLTNSLLLSGSNAGGVIASSSGPVTIAPANSVTAVTGAITSTGDATLASAGTNGVGSAKGFYATGASGYAGANSVLFDFSTGLRGIVFGADATHYANVRLQQYFSDATGPKTAFEITTGQVVRLGDQSSNYFTMTAQANPELSSTAGIFVLRSKTAGDQVYIHDGVSDVARFAASAGAVVNWFSFNSYAAGTDAVMATSAANMYIKPAAGIVVFKSGTNNPGNPSQINIEQQNATDGWHIKCDGATGGELRFYRSASSTEYQVAYLSSSTTDVALELTATQASAADKNPLVIGRGSAYTNGFGYHISWHDGSNFVAKLGTRYDTTSALGVSDGMLLTVNSMYQSGSYRTGISWAFRGPVGNPVNFGVCWGSLTTAAIHIAAEGTDTNITTQIDGKGTGGGKIKGTGTNDDVATGYVGEYIETTVASGSAVSLTNNVAANMGSISVPAGDWEIYFSPILTGGATTTVTGFAFDISLTSATITSLVGCETSERRASFALFNGDDYRRETTVVRKSLAATTTIYGVASVTFGTSTCALYGRICARRIR